MSVLDTLYVFALIKGCNYKYAWKVANEQARYYDLEPHAHKLAHQLSGGNKRKLVLAMTMLGCPSIVLLDECSAGVDPNSRRKLWQQIKRDQKNTGVILTTHAMEEAQALASNIAIMVDGQFRCMGTYQDLKNKFCKGYEVEFKLDLSKISESFGYLFVGMKGKNFFTEE